MLLSFDENFLKWQEAFMNILESNVWYLAKYKPYQSHIILHDNETHTFPKGQILGPVNIEVTPPHFLVQM